MTTVPTNIVTEYLNLTKEYIEKYGKNTVVLMQVGSFFEIYALKSPSTNVISGSNLEDVCQLCGLNYAEKKICVGESNVLMAGVRDYVLDKYVKILTENQYTAVVFVQEKGDTKITRVLHAVYSAGTYLSFDTDSSPKMTNNIMCIWIEKTKTITQKQHDTMICGISVINIFTGESFIFEYQLPYFLNPTTFDELERCVSVYSPSEVIFISTMEENVQKTIIQYAGISSTAINIVKPTQEKVEKCEKQIYISQLLSTFFGDDSYNICKEFTDNILATQSLCYLLDYIQEHNQNLIKRLSMPRFINNSSRVVLANHTLQQLNIIDGYNEKGMGNLSSVSSFLNKCCTPMGRRMFQRQLTSPTSDKGWLYTEYEMTGFMLEDQRRELIDFLRKKLPLIRDMEKLCRQIVIKKIYPNSLYYLYQSLLGIDEVCKQIYSPDLIKIVSYLGLHKTRYCDYKAATQKIIEYIDTHIYVKECSGINSVTTFDTNIIRPGVSTDLDEMLLRQKLEREAFFAIHELLNKWMRKHENDKKNTEYVKCHETEKSGCTLQITKKRGVSLNTFIKNELKADPEKKITINEKCIISLKDFELRNASSNIDEIYFPELSKICKNMLSVEDELNREISKIYSQVLLNIEEQFFNDLEDLAQMIAKIDVLHCKAYIAINYNYCRPTITSDREISFVESKGLRHCLIEHINQNEIYVTNDLSLGDYNKGILLYGTNAVGKTSLIRALGISIIMAQAGLYVPATEFTYNPYTAIYSRILGNDNLFKGLSTFAVEMSELRVILKHADQNSLILGDEICSGTETVSALSIFVTTLQHLANLKSNYVFATHFHEIVNYPEVTSIMTLKMYHLSVSYDRTYDCLVYDRKLRDGSGDSNYGLIVAKSLYLPEEFLENAYDFRRKYFPEKAGSELSNNITTYNAKKIRGICEKCKIELAEEIHHLQPQRLADENGFIETFHKNHPANLIGLCNKCHLEEHHEENPLKKKKKTTKGYIIKNANG